MSKRSLILCATPKRVQLTDLSKSNGLIKQLTRSNASASAGSHAASTHWNAERYQSIALLAIIPAAFYFDSSIMDNVLALSLVAHSHWGLHSIITDYVHGPVLPKWAFGMLFVVSALTLVGLLYFNYSDIGMSKAIKKIWTL